MIFRKWSTRQIIPINLPAIVLNNIFVCYNVKWQNITMYITYGRVFGGTPNILIFWVISWKWNIFGANNEQGIHSSYRSIRSGINKRKLSHLIFCQIPKLSCGFKCESGILLSYLTAKAKWIGVSPDRDDTLSIRTEFTYRDRISYPHSFPPRTGLTPE